MECSNILKPNVSRNLVLLTGKYNLTFALPSGGGKKSAQGREFKTYKKKEMKKEENEKRKKKKEKRKKKEVKN